MTDATGQGRDRNHDWRPIPDPTVLTTDAVERATEVLLREIAALRELLLTRIKGQGDVMHERFRKIHEQFDSVERARLEQKADSKEALAAALAAREEAVAKAEVSIEKRADATYVAVADLQANLGALMSRTEAESRFKAEDAAIAELKERVVRMEERKLGGQEGMVERRAGSQQSLNIIAAVVWVILVVISVVTVILLIANQGATP